MNTIRKVLRAVCLNVACSGGFLDACLSATLSTVTFIRSITIKNLWAVGVMNIINKTTIRPIVGRSYEYR